MAHVGIIASIWGYIGFRVYGLLLRNLNQVIPYWVYVVLNLGQSPTQ